MNRRSFIRSALAAAFGAAAGALMPKIPVEQVAQIFAQSSTVSPGMKTFHLIEWIEDSECPEDMVFFIPKHMGIRAVGQLRAIKNIQKSRKEINPYKQH